MTLTTIQLWERIHGCGLASPEECRRWAIEIAQRSGSETLHDTANLAKELVRLGKLTPYQANVVYRDLPLPIALERYSIVASLESVLGPNWYEAKSLTSAEKIVWVFAISAHQLEDAPYADWPPSLSLAQQHQAVSHPSLDRWLECFACKNYLVAVCESMPGASMRQQQPLAWEDATARIEQVALGLQKLHSHQLIHGSVGSHAVWCVDEVECRLRRDPLFPPQSPYAQSNATLLRRGSPAYGYAAPEYMLPGCAPGVQQDLYALGCLWYESMIGQPPFASDTAPDSSSDWMQAHATESWNHPALSKLPSAIRQCLNHLLARNANARFATVTQFLAALEAAIAHPSQELGALPEASVVPTAPISPATPATQPAIAPASAAPTVPTIESAARSTVETVEPSVKQPSKPQEPSAPAAPTKPAVDKQKVAPKQLEPTQPTRKEAVAESLSASSAVLPQTELPGKDPTPIAAASIPATPASKEASPAERPEIPITAQTGAIPSVPKDALQSPTIVANAQSVPETAMATEATVPPVKKRKKKKKIDGKGVQDSTIKPKKKKKGKPNWVFPTVVGVSVVVLLGITALLLKSGGGIRIDTTNSHRTAQNNTSPNANAVSNTDKGNENKGPPADPLAEHFVLASGDARSPWAPPTFGSPYSLDLIPAGAQGFVFISGKLWKGVGATKPLADWWHQMQPSISEFLGQLPWQKDASITHVAIAMYPSKQEGWPRYVVRFEFAEPRTSENVHNAATEFESALIPGNKGALWTREQSGEVLAYVIDGLAGDADAATTHVTIGPLDLIQSLSELNGGSAPLKRQMEMLLQSTDRRSDLTVLVAPSFLFIEGRELLLSTLPNFQGTLKGTIGETSQAVMLTSTVEPNWYFETRLIGNDIKEAGRLASELKSKLDALPDTIEGMLVNAPAHPYWRALAARYPQMLRALSRYSRIGVEDGQIVANAYLPSEAATNLIVSSWFAMKSSGDAKAGSTVATNTKKPSENAAKKSMDEILNSPLSIAFEQESLESAVQLIAGEAGESKITGGAPMRMNINGSAFQKEGITRNQQIRGFKQASVPLRKILTDLVRKANPVTTVQEPTEKDQKVVWVVIDDPENPGQKMIELTTRTWATANKVDLPKEFVP